MGVVMKGKEFVHYSLDDLRDAIKKGHCWSDVCRTVGVSVCAFNINRTRGLAKKYEIDIDHFDVKKSFRKGKFEWTPEMVFVRDSKITRCRLRPALIRFGFYTGKCEGCGVGEEWNGKPLTIEIDHINGISTDNRKENLRWLCPNCHSQTDTYRRRNKASV
jgi:hypothetical protein